MTSLNHAPTEINNGYLLQGEAISLTYRHLQGSDSVVDKDLLLKERDFEGTISGAPTVWPVLLTLLLVALLQVGHHDDGGRPLLPHQPPEVNENMLFGT